MIKGNYSVCLVKTKYSKVFKRHTLFLLIYDCVTEWFNKWVSIDLFLLGTFKIIIHSDDNLKQCYENYGLIRSMKYAKNKTVLLKQIF